MDFDSQLFTAVNFCWF